MQFNELLVEVRAAAKRNAEVRLLHRGRFYHPSPSRDHVVQQALTSIAKQVRINYSSNAHVTAEWRERFHNFGELNRPAWDQAN